MSPVSAIVLFLVIWWMILFMVLPWGVKIPEKPATGHATSAPEKAKLVKKFIITTLIAIPVWGIAYGVIESGWISFREEDPWSLEKDERDQ